MMASVVAYACLAAAFITPTLFAIIIHKNVSKVES